MLWFYDQTMNKKMLRGKNDPMVVLVFKNAVFLLLLYV